MHTALGAELTDHLGYEKGDPAGCDKGNSRNGTSSKTVLTEDGEVEIAVPRDRAGSFEPQLIAKGQTVRKTALTSPPLRDSKGHPFERSAVAHARHWFYLGCDDSSAATAEADICNRCLRSLLDHAPPPI